MHLYDKFWKILVTYFCLFASCGLQAEDKGGFSNGQSLSTSLASPTHVRGRQVTHQFTSQTDVVNVISWKAPSKGLTPVAYRIYRDSQLTVLIATISADAKLKFKDHNRRKHHDYSYFIVSVDASGNQSKAVGILFEGSKVSLIKPAKPKLVAIEINPVIPVVATGFTVQFTATGIFSDESTKDLTNCVKWVSSNPNVAVISNDPPTKGLAIGLTPGTTTIEAICKNFSASTTLTVTAASLVAIEVTPVDPTVAAGFTIQFTAIGLFNDNTTENLTHEVTWISTVPSVAVISNDPTTKGLATGLTPGTTTIEATLNGMTGSTTLTVTAAVLLQIEVTPIEPKVAAGFEVQFMATGVFSDLTTEDLTHEVTWISTVPSVAVISNDPATKGLATSIAPGITIIEATLNGMTGSMPLTVTEATLQFIEVIPSNNSMIAVGNTIQFTAIGHFSDGSIEDLRESVIWISTSPGVAAISNDPTNKGLATGLAPGTTTIEATLHGITGSATLTVTNAVLVAITVTPANASVPAGFTIQYTAMGLFSDMTTANITNSVTWESSSSGVAFISNDPISKGLATGLAVGTTTITAIQGVISGSTTLNVISAVLTSIQVLPTNPTGIAGVTQFTAIGNFSAGPPEDLTNSVTWLSSNQNVAMISNAVGSKGLATGLLVGSSTITATQAGVTGSTVLTVTCSAIQIITTSLPIATVGISYDQFISIANAVSPIQVSLVAGTLPPGLILSPLNFPILPFAQISGRPTGPTGTYNFTIQIRSNCGTTAVQSFSITVN